MSAYGTPKAPRRQAVSTKQKTKAGINIKKSGDSLSPSSANAFIEGIDNDPVSSAALLQKHVRSKINWDGIRDTLAVSHRLESENTLMRVLEVLRPTPQSAAEEAMDDGSRNLDMKEPQQVRADLKGVRVKLETFDGFLKQIIEENHLEYKTRIDTFSEIVDNIDSTRREIRMLKSNINDVKMHLEVNEKELRTKHINAAVAKEMHRVLLRITEIKDIPDETVIAISLKDYKRAVDLLGSADRDLCLASLRSKRGIFSSPEERESEITARELERVGSLCMIREVVADLKQILPDILIHELKRHIYLHSPYCWIPKDSSLFEGPGVLDAASLAELDEDSLGIAYFLMPAIVLSDNVDEGTTLYLSGNQCSNEVSPGLLKILDEISGYRRASRGVDHGLRFCDINNVMLCTRLLLMRPKSLDSISAYLQIADEDSDHSYDALKSPELNSGRFMHLVCTAIEGLNTIEGGRFSNTRVYTKKLLKSLRDDLVGNRDALTNIVRHTLLITDYDLRIKLRQDRSGSGRKNYGKGINGAFEARRRSNDVLSYLDFLFSILLRVIENHALVLRFIRNAEQGHHVKTDRVRPGVVSTAGGLNLSVSGTGVGSTNIGHAYIFTATEDTDVLKDVYSVSMVWDAVQEELELLLRDLLLPPNGAIPGISDGDPFSGMDLVSAHLSKELRFTFADLTDAGALALSDANALHDHKRSSSSSNYSRLSNSELRPSPFHIMKIYRPLMKFVARVMRILEEENSIEDNSTEIKDSNCSSRLKNYVDECTKTFLSSLEKDTLRDVVVFLGDDDGFKPTSWGSGEYRPSIETKMQGIVKVIAKVEDLFRGLVEMPNYVDAFLLVVKNVLSLLYDTIAKQLILILSKTTAFSHISEGVRFDVDNMQRCLADAAYIRLLMKDPRWAAVNCSEIRQNLDRKHPIDGESTLSQENYGYLFDDMSSDEFCNHLCDHSGSVYVFDDDGASSVMVLDSYSQVQSLAIFCDSLEWVAQTLMDLVAPLPDPATVDMEIQDMLVSAASENVNNNNISTNSADVDSVGNDRNSMQQLRDAAKFRTEIELISRGLINLSDIALHALREEVSVRCFGILCEINCDYYFDDVQREPDALILKVNRDLVRIDESCIAFLTPAKRAYVFDCLPRQLCTILTTMMKSIKAVNEYGVRRMVRNVVALQQNLTNIVSPDAGTSEEAWFIKCKDYFELAVVPQQKLLQEISNETLVRFTEEEYKWLLLVNTGEDKDESSILVLEHLFEAKRQVNKESNRRVKPKHKTSRSRSPLEDIDSE